MSSFPSPSGHSRSATFVGTRSKPGIYPYTQPREIFVMLSEAQLEAIRRIARMPWIPVAELAAPVDPVDDRGRSDAAYERSLEART